jgi:VanZ like family/Concanavalin A-like lectin/glucanases superfamily
MQMLAFVAQPPTRKMIAASIPRLICVLVLVGILVAGLAPFGRPRNAVKWLGNENGVVFGRHGTIWSAGAFPKADAQSKPSCSLEMWLQPGSTSASSTLLAFYRPENPLQFLLQQYQALLILSRQMRGDDNRTQVIGTGGVFPRIEPRFVTLTSGAENTAMYVDGKLVRSFPHVQIGEGCSGKLVIGISPVGGSNWTGQLKGLALYQQELTPTEVLQHYESWTAQGRPKLSGNEHAIALYLFNERTGNTVHNNLGAGIDLYIPERFSLLQQQFLEPFWSEFKLSRSYGEDILVNIVGFIPLGFFICAYWSAVRPIKRPNLTTVFFGLAISLTIEVLQSYLPTRDSGTTDLITNTLGTFLGVRLYGWKTARALLAKLY